MARSAPPSSGSALEATAPPSGDIGVDTDGETVSGSNTPVQVNGGIGANTVGGTAPDARNVIASTTGQVTLILNDGTTTLVLGNYLGINAAGTAPIGSGAFGITLETSATISDITIGGNVIVASSAAINCGSGSARISNITIQGNLMGTDATGTVGLQRLSRDQPGRRGSVCSLPNLRGCGSSVVAPNFIFQLRNILSELRSALRGEECYENIN